MIKIEIGKDTHKWIKGFMKVHRIEKEAEAVEQLCRNYRTWNKSLLQIKFDAKDFPDEKEYCDLEVD